MSKTLLSKAGFKKHVITLIGNEFFTIVTGWHYQDHQYFGASTNKIVASLSRMSMAAERVYIFIPFISYFVLFFHCI
jgi:hypothetical protein